MQDEVRFEAQIEVRVAPLDHGNLISFLPLCRA
jgi:hypothetical protein